MRKLLLIAFLCTSCDDATPTHTKAELLDLRRFWATGLDREGGGHGDVRLTGAAEDELELKLADCSGVTLAGLMTSPEMVKNLKRLEFSALSCGNGKFRITAPWD